ncbi:uncharacterized protein LOC131647346 [Vicia villosa]|uniref:uncharacterized protein LOC131647346 n=1 Tax=Vicia villosa TaxID=3911 RepID=UPI00273CD975|nr:uncharacterized protein LOC131647346 [Vicia villosa]
MGKNGHTVPECKHKEVICFNCGGEGRISSQCQKPKKAQGSGKVFALAGTQTTTEDILIRGLMLSFMNGEMVVEIPDKESVTTYLVCLKCPLSIFDRDFAIDLVCLPLSGLDVILGMNWLEYKYVHINCYKKSVRFSTPEKEETGLLSARQLRKMMQEEAQVVREFPEIFPDEIPDVPPKREVEFMINLVLGT